METPKERWFQSFLAALNGACTDADMRPDAAIRFSATVADEVEKEFQKRWGAEVKPDGN